MISPSTSFPPLLPYPFDSSRIQELFFFITVKYINECIDLLIRAAEFIYCCLYVYNVRADRLVLRNQ